MHPLLILKKCCCPCYPEWLRDVVGSSSGGAGELIIPRFNVWGISDIYDERGPAPKFLNVHFLLNDPAMFGEGPAPDRSAWNRVNFDIQAIDWTFNTTSAPGFWCNGDITYCGKIEGLNLVVPKLDGSGDTVTIQGLSAWLRMETYIGGGFEGDDCLLGTVRVWNYFNVRAKIAGEWQTIYWGGSGGTYGGGITSIASGILAVPDINSGFPYDSTVALASRPGPYDPGDMPIMVSPLEPDPRQSSASMIAYPRVYTHQGWHVLPALRCTRRKADLPDAQACEDEDSAFSSYQTSFFSSEDTPGSSTPASSTPSSDPSSSDPGGSSSGGISGGAFYLEALVCGTDEPSGLFYDFTGVDDGTVWKQPDGTCVYADLSLEATETSTPAVDMTDPQVSCAMCCSTCDAYYFGYDEGTGMVTLDDAEYSISCDGEFDSGWVGTGPGTWSRTIQVCAGSPQPNPSFP